MTDITLTPMTPQDLDAFISEEVADYADDRVRDGTWARCEALDCARGAMAKVVDWERQAARSDRQRLWTAVAPSGERVGWFWVKLAPPDACPTGPQAFLCQMTVARAHRRHGYGRAMLAALEDLLRADGIVEVHMNVCEENVPALHLYTAAGYETAQRYPTMRQLRKRLDSGALAALRAEPSERLAS